VSVRRSSDSRRPAASTASRGSRCAIPRGLTLVGPALEEALGALRVLIVKAGTGGALFRSLHAEFLHDMGDLLDDRRLTEMGATYDELAGLWVDLATAAGDRRHQDGVPIVEAIARLEREGVEAMERWLA
jgi:hypothetical protein